MNAEVFLCRSEDLVEGRFQELVVHRDDHDVSLVATRHQGEAKAWLNVCPHQGRPLNWAPDRFIVDGEGRLVCAAHGAVFEPGEGLCVSGPCKNASLRGVDLTERRGDVLLSLPA